MCGAGPHTIGRIDLRAFLDGGWLVIEVRTTARNSRGHPARVGQPGGHLSTKPQRGLGFGLKIVHEVARQHRGGSRFESQFGRERRRSDEFPVRDPEPKQ